MVAGSPVAAEAAARLRERFVCVDVAMRGASVLVSVTDARAPPYLIENDTNLSLMLHQRGMPQRRRT